MQVLETLLQRSLGEFAQWQFISIVTNLLQHCIEMVLVEDEFHQSLRLPWQFALDFRLVIFLLFYLVVGVIVVVVFVILLQEGVLSLLGRFRSIFPFVAGFVLEFLLEFFESIIEGLGTHGFDLTEFADTTPTGVCIVLVFLLVMKKLYSVEL